MDVETMTARHSRDFTPAQWMRIHAAQGAHHAREFIWVLRLLEAGRGTVDGFPVDQLTHNLQLATRLEAAGVREELVLAGLVHDVAKPLSLTYHAELGAAMLREYVSAPTYYILRHHGEGASAINHHDVGALERYRGRPWFRELVLFSDLDTASYDPDYPTRPLDCFLAGLRRLYRLPADVPVG
jgi:predicted HD phosphohydrolase